MSRLPALFSADSSFTINACKQQNENLKREKRFLEVAKVLVKQHIWPTEHRISRTSASYWHNDKVAFHSNKRNAFDKLTYDHPYDINLLLKILNASNESKVDSFGKK